MVMYDPDESSGTYQARLDKKPKAKLATNFPVGVAVRKVTAGGATFEDTVGAWPMDTNDSADRDSAAEIPDKTAGWTSLDPIYKEAELEEVDGASSGNKYFLTSGTGAITSGTTLNSELSVKNGLLQVKQSGETPLYTLSAILPAEEASHLRILVTRIGGD